MTKIHELNFNKITFTKKLSISYPRLCETCYPIIKEGKESEDAYQVEINDHSKALNDINEFLHSDGNFFY